MNFLSIWSHASFFQSYVVLIFCFHLTTPWASTYYHSLEAKCKLSCFWIKQSVVHVSFPCLVQFREPCHLGHQLSNISLLFTFATIDGCLLHRKVMPGRSDHAKVTTLSKACTCTYVDKRIQVHMPVFKWIHSLYIYIYIDVHVNVYIYIYVYILTIAYIHPKTLDASIANIEWWRLC